MPNLNALLETEFRWPEIGDRLFASTRSASDARVAEDAHERLYHMTKGYKEAADLLVEKTDAQPFLRTSLVYPIVFCYRHFLELSLKTLLKEYGGLGNISENWRSHGLEDLWRAIRSLLQSVDGDQNEEQGTDAVESCIAEFAKIDPISMTFRYPFTKRGESINDIFRSVDLSHLQNTMTKIETYFLGCNGFFDEMQRIRTDFNEFD